MPTPRIIYEGDEAAAHQHLTVAQNLLHKVRTMAAASGAGVVGQSFAPDPSSYIYVLKVGDTEVVHIFSAPETSYTPPTYETPGQFPDFYSGAVRDPRLRTYTDEKQRPYTVLESFRPTAETAKAAKLDNGYQSVKRLAVRPHPSVVSATVYDWMSQYTVVDASNYSGLMRKLVQVLLGYGRLPNWAITGDAKTKAEVQSAGLQVRYDSRFHRTHILTTAKDGKLWLVEISIANGVLAVPLPVYKDSGVLKDSERESIAEAVKLFKGLPTGEPFPSGKALAAGLKDGTILRLASAGDMSDYARLTPFSTAMGWCVNSAGTEAHNTGFYMHEDNIYRACHYSLQISIGALKKDREKDEPIADGTATLRRVSEGKFYHPSKKFPPPIKFYEPLLGGLLSVEFLSAFGADTSAQRLKVMDTTMHVFYIDDQLKKVNFFWDRTVQPGQETVLDTRDDCMWVGAWTFAYRYNVQMSPTFYMTDVDDRRQPDASTGENNIVGRDAGYWINSYSVDSSRLYFPQWDTVWRNRVFRGQFSSKSENDRWSRAAIVVPQGSRDVCVYALLDHTGSSRSDGSVQFYQLTDPHWYYSYRYVYDSYKPTTECWTQTERRIREKYFAPGNSSQYDFGGNVNIPCALELVDKGDWLEFCDVIDNINRGPGLPSGYATETKVKASETKVTARLYVDDGFDRATELQPIVDNDYVWLAHSPDLDTPSDVQQMSARYSTFSTSRQIVYSKSLNGSLLRKGSLVNDSTDTVHHFVGRT